jgi:predicted dinucleotide-binding enzyme
MFFPMQKAADYYLTPHGQRERDRRRTRSIAETTKEQRAQLPVSPAMWGFNPVTMGRLSTARYLEPLSLLVAQLAQKARH